MATNEIDHDGGRPENKARNTLPRADAIATAI